MKKNKNKVKIDGLTLDAVIENNLGITDGVGELQGVPALIRAENAFLKRRLPTLNQAMQEAGVDKFFDLDRFKFIANHLFGPDEKASSQSLKRGLYTKAIEIRNEPVNPQYEDASFYLDSDEIADAFNEVTFHISSMLNFADEPGNDIHESPDDRKQFIKDLSQCYSQMLQASPLKNKSPMVALIVTEQLAQELDHTLDLSTMNPATLHQINKEAVKGNLSNLEKLFDENCKTVYDLSESVLNIDSKSLVNTISAINGTSDEIFPTEKGRETSYLSRYNIQVEESAIKREGRGGSSLEP